LEDLVYFSSIIHSKIAFFSIEHNVRAKKSKKKDGSSLNQAERLMIQTHQISPYITRLIFIEDFSRFLSLHPAVNSNEIFYFPSSSQCPKERISQKVETEEILNASKNQILIPFIPSSN